jgi:hypothetical protein
MLAAANASHKSCRTPRSLNEVVAPAEYFRTSRPLSAMHTKRLLLLKASMAK